MNSDIVPHIITDGYLAGLDDDTLLDLLQTKTRHLLAATNSHLPNPVFINCLKEDLEKIQKAIKDRMI